MLEPAATAADSDAVALAVVVLRAIAPVLPKSKKELLSRLREHPFTQNSRVFPQEDPMPVECALHCGRRPQHPPHRIVRVPMWHQSDFRLI